jgi:recombination protein RecA
MPAKKTAKTAAKKTAKKTSSASTAKKTTKKVAKKKTANKTANKNPLKAAREFLNKQLKKTDWKADLDTSQLTGSIPHFKSGSLILDHLIGGKANENGIPPCPGIPKGKIFNLYGHEGSGKTTVALTAAASVIEAGGTVCYIDWENEIVPKYAKALGVPIDDEDKFVLSQPETLEEGCSVLWGMAGHGVDLIVLDSVGAGVPAALMEKSVKEVAEGGRLGANAAIWSKFLPKVKRLITRSETTIIAISQLRSAVNVMGYGEQFTVQGGKAWRFYSALRMHLKAIGKDKTNIYDPLTNKTVERVVGVKTRARLEKCKVSPQQGNEEVFYIRWGKGIDDLRSLMEIGMAHKIVKKSGSWYAWTDPEGEDHSYQGLEKLRVFFEKNPQAAKVLERQITPYMAGSGSGDTFGDEADIPEDDFNPDNFADDPDLAGILSGNALDE